MLDALLAEARLRWGLDASAGLQVAAAERLIGTPIEASRPLIIVPLASLSASPAPDGPAIDLALAGRHGPSGRDPLTLLGRLYPADHPVGRFGQTAETTIGALTGDDLRAPLYIGPLAPELASAGPWSMPWISHRLRQPDGCPWDREQTHESLRKHLLEEAYEVYDALADGPTPALAEELGDLLLQVSSTPSSPPRPASSTWPTSRRPWPPRSSAAIPMSSGRPRRARPSDVNRQWERIKADERATAAETAERRASWPAPPKSALDGISRSMPALAASQEMQERAAALGYDWPTIDGILAKLHEELGELLEAGTARDREEELGDLLMVAVNLGRRQGVEAEAALRSANDKFRRRFRSVERQAAEQGVALRDLDFDQLDVLWAQAKSEEQCTPTRHLETPR